MESPPSSHHRKGCIRSDRKHTLSSFFSLLHSICHLFSFLSILLFSSLHLTKKNDSVPLFLRPNQITASKSDLATSSRLNVQTTQMQYIEQWVRISCTHQGVKSLDSRHQNKETWHFNKDVWVTEISDAKQQGGQIVFSLFLEIVKNGKLTKSPQIGPMLRSAWLRLDQVKHY